jgi:hypothetical protein
MEQVKTRTKNPADIVPDELQTRLIQIREDSLRNYFEIGDIANELIQLDAERGIPVLVSDVMYAVGVFAGKSARTVRYYADVSRFFVKEIREAYLELPFNFFVVAQSYGERWREVLDYALDHMLLSEDQLRDQFSIRRVETEYQTPLVYPVQEERLIRPEQIRSSLRGEAMREVRLDLEMPKIPPLPDYRLTSDTTEAVIKLSDAVRAIDNVFSRLSSEFHLSAFVMGEFTDALETLRKHIPALMEAASRAKIAPKQGIK